MEVKSKDLDPPTLTANGKSLNIVEGGWRFDGNPRGFDVGAGSCRELHIIWFDKGSNETTPSKVTDRLRRVLRDYNVSPDGLSSIKPIWEFRTTPQHQNNPIQYRTTCQSILNGCLNALRLRAENREVKALFIILKNQDTEFYAEIKRWGDCVAGVPTICAKNETLFPRPAPGKKQKPDHGSPALCANIR